MCRRVDHLTKRSKIFPVPPPIDHGARQTRYRKSTYSHLFSACYAFSVATYVYLLTTSDKVTATNMPAAKEELCRLFQCDTVDEAGAGHFRILTNLEPLQVDKAIRAFSERYGRTEFRAGSKLDPGDFGGGT